MALVEYCKHEDGTAEVFVGARRRRLPYVRIHLDLDDAKDVIVVEERVAT